MEGRTYTVIVTTEFGESSPWTRVPSGTNIVDLGAVRSPWTEVAAHMWLFPDGSSRIGRSPEDYERLGKIMPVERFESK